jgi:DNA-binding transcriptional MocR family regulator
VFVTIANFFNEKKGYAWPGIALVARLTELSERHVKRSLRELEAQGLIESEYRFDPETGRQTSTRYRLPLYRDAGGVTVTPEGDVRSPHP